MDIVEHLRDLKLDVAADEIERLRKELAKRPRMDESMLKGATDTAALIVNELRQQLAECERERDEAYCDVEEADRRLATVTSERDGIALLITSTKAELQEQLATMTAERDELVAALEEIGNTACGEASHQYIALAALAKLGADKGEGS